MAEATQNATTPAAQIGSAAGQLMAGLLGLFSSISSWTRVVALATFLAFVLLYMGKLPLPKADDTNARNALNVLHTDIVALKADLGRQFGELSGQLDVIEVQTRLPPAPAVPEGLKVRRKKSVAIPAN
jgi:hypothetical protein